MEKVRILIVALTVALLGTGKGYAMGYDINVGEFSELKVSGGINVDYVASEDSAGYVHFECQPEVVSCIILSNKKGKLTVQLSPESTVAREYPTVKVYSRYLNKVANYADSTVRVLSVHDTPQFEALLEGNGRLIVRNLDTTKAQITGRMGHGTVVVDGKCTEAKYKLMGACVMQCDGLKAQDVDVVAYGTGSIGLSAEKKLSVFGPGSTKIYYMGTPAIKNRSVGLKLIPISSVD